MRSRFALFLIVILLFLSYQASASMVVNKYTNDFVVSSPNNEQLKVCGCQSVQDPIFIENTGNFYTNYVIELISPVSSWMSLSESEITIAPKERKMIINYVDVPCSEVGTYDYTVKVVSSYGRTEYLKRTIRADTCENVHISMSPESVLSNLCQNVTFNLTIRNTGSFPEFYDVSFGEFDEFVSGPKRLYLPPEKDLMKSYVLTLPCTFYGDYDVAATVRGEKNKVEESVVSKLSVENQFDHKIMVDTAVPLCSRVSQKIPLSVINSVNVPNTFDLDISGPGFVSISPDDRVFSLEGNDSRRIKLLASPNEGEEGNYTLTVTVSSKYGEITKSRDIELDVKNCYDFSTSMLDVNKQPLASDTSCCGYHEYYLNVRNRGQTEETYNLLVDGPSWFVPEELTVRLKPGENKNVKFFSQNPCSDNTYEIPVTVVLNRFPEVNETVNFVINSQSQRTCHYVSIDADEAEVPYTQNVVPLVVHNNGSEGGIYELSLNSSLFALKEDELVIFPGESRIIHIVAKDNLSEDDIGRFVVEPIFTYSVEDNPQALESVSYVEHVGVTVKDKSLITKFFDWLFFIDWGAPGLCGWASILLSLLLVVVVILIFVFGNKDPVMSAGLIAFFKIVLLLALLGVFVALAIVKMPPHSALYEAPPGNDYLAVIEQDRVAEINMSPYFEDPDGDILYFTASQPKDLSARMDGNILLLKPDPGFSGEDELVVTAYDGHGGYEDSPVFKVFVKARKNLGFFGLWMLYCKQINLFLLLLIIICLLIILLMVKPRKDNDDRFKVVLEAPPVKPTPEDSLKKGTVSPVTPKARPRVHSSTASKGASRDRNLVSNQPHELSYILRKFGKRSTKRNLEIISGALRDFKKSRYSPKNRASFYRYLREQGVLRRLRNKR